MARKLPRRLVNPEIAEVKESDPILAAAKERHASTTSGVGGRGAWSAASTQVLTSQLTKLQQERMAKLLSGDLVIELRPEQICDDIGSDRNSDWKADEAFALLKSSISENGQDMPIQVQPLEQDWVPSFDETSGLIVNKAKFRVIGGRRRLEALRQLKLNVRAVCVATDKAEGFDQLHRRFRENVERQNLSLFDELLSIGEMFSHEKTFGDKMTGRTLSHRLGVSESKVSKGRALYDNRERLLEEVGDPHSLTLHQLDALIPALRNGAPLPKLESNLEPAIVKAGAQPPNRQPTNPALKRTQIIKGRKIVAKAKGGRITLDLGGEAELDESFLDRLLLFIQTERGK